MTACTRRIAFLALAAGLAGPSLGAAAPTSAGAASLERFKALAGEWVAAEDGPMSKKGDLVARYAVTAAGSAVVETVFPGTPHEMVTVYYPTAPTWCSRTSAWRATSRACAPRRPPARGSTSPSTAARNIDPRSDRHMHSAWFEFVGADEIRSEWTEHRGRQARASSPSHLVRKR